MTSEVGQLGPKVTEYGRRPTSLREGGGPVFSAFSLTLVGCGDILRIGD